jgi:hypothetical protein
MRLINETWLHTRIAESLKPQYSLRAFSDWWGRVHVDFVPLPAWN